MANTQVLYQGTSGTMIEFKLEHSGGNTVSGATPLISFISPGDSTLQQLNNPEIVELPPTQTSGYYLVRPSLAMVDKIGSLTVYASGVGRAVGQAGLVQSNVTRTYVDIIGGEQPGFTINSTFASGTPKLGYSVLPTSHRPTVFVQV